MRCRIEGLLVVVGVEDGHVAHLGPIDHDDPLGLALINVISDAPLYWND